MYATALEDAQVRAEIDHEPPSPQKTPNEAKASCSVSNVLKKTIDGRKCVSICTKDHPPPHPDAPMCPIEAKIGQSLLGPGSDSVEIDEN